MIDEDLDISSFPPDIKVPKSAFAVLPSDRNPFNLLKHFPVSSPVPLPEKKTEIGEQLAVLSNERVTEQFLSSSNPLQHSYLQRAMGPTDFKLNPLFAAANDPSGERNVGKGPLITSLSINEPPTSLFKSSAYPFLQPTPELPNATITPSSFSPRPPSVFKKQKFEESGKENISSASNNSILFASFCQIPNYPSNKINDSVGAAFSSTTEGSPNNFCSSKGKKSKISSIVPLKQFIRKDTSFDNAWTALLKSEAIAACSFKDLEKDLKKNLPSKTSLSEQNPDFLEICTSKIQSASYNIRSISPRPASDHFNYSSFTDPNTKVTLV